MYVSILMQTHPVAYIHLMSETFSMCDRYEDSLMVYYLLLCCCSPAIESMYYISCICRWCLYPSFCANVLYGDFFGDVKLATIHCGTCHLHKHIFNISILHQNSFCSLFLCISFVWRVYIFHSFSCHCERVTMIAESRARRENESNWKLSKGKYNGLA